MPMCLRPSQFLASIVLASIVSALLPGSASAWPGPGDTRQATRPGPNRPAGGTGADLHPLAPVLEISYQARENIQQVRDYTCLFTKRERVDGKLTDVQQIALKIRHAPFSVYMRFLRPDNLEGQEALYVQGANDGKLLAHATGLKKLAGTVALDPESSWAMKGNRYPITQAGILPMINRMIEIGEHDAQYGECDVQFLRGAKVDGRACLCMQVTHPVPRRNFEYHLSRVFIDEQWQIPVRTEVYDWPRKTGDAPVLVGEYTFTRMQFNVGLSDLDFDTRNPAYNY